MDPDELARYVTARVDEDERAAELAMPDGVLEWTPHRVFDDCRGMRALLAWREAQHRSFRDDPWLGDAEEPWAVARGRAEAADEALAVYAREAYRHRDDWPGEGP